MKFLHSIALTALLCIGPLLAVGQWEHVHLNRIGTQLRMDGDQTLVYFLTFNDSGFSTAFLEWRNPDGEWVRSESVELPDDGQWACGPRGSHAETDTSWFWVFAGPNGVYLLEQDLISGDIVGLALADASDEMQGVIPYSVEAGNDGSLLVAGQYSSGGESYFGTLDPDANTFELDATNLLPDEFLESFRFSEKVGSGTVHYGITSAVWDPPFSTFSPVIGMFSDDFSLEWSVALGNEVLHDRWPMVKPFGTDSLLVFHPFADFLPSTTTNELSTRNTLWRKVLDHQGQVISERSYIDSMVNVQLYDLEIANERIYLTGQKWTGTGLFAHTFLLVTDLEGETLNYRELHVDSCFYCESNFQDLELDPFGNLYGFGLFRNFDENETYTWLRKFDCLGNDSTPDLSFHPTGVLYPDGSAQVWLENEAFESVQWMVNGEWFTEDTLTVNDWESLSIDLSISGQYCDLERDTSLVLDLAVGVEDMESLVRLFPNPATHRITLETGLLDGLDIQVVNALGQRVWHQSNASGPVHIDTAAWPRGCYVVTAVHPAGSAVRRRVVLE